jgi:hypothetical protein
LNVVDGLLASLAECWHARAQLQQINEQQAKEIRDLRERLEQVAARHKPEIPES